MTHSIHIPGIPFQVCIQPSIHWSDRLSVDQRKPVLFYGHIQPDGETGFTSQSAMATMALLFPFRLLDVFFLLICRLFVYIVLLRVFYNLIDFFGSAAHKRTPNSVCGFVANQSNKHINFRLNFSCICIGDQDQGQDQDQSVSTTNKSQVRKDEC